MYRITLRTDSQACRRRTCLAGGVSGGNWWLEVTAKGWGPRARWAGRYAGVNVTWVAGNKVWISRALAARVCGGAGRKVARAEGLGRLRQSRHGIRAELPARDWLPL